MERNLARAWVVLLVVGPFSRAAEPGSTEGRTATALTIIDEAAWSTRPRRPWYIEAIDREGGDKPWYNEVILRRGGGLRDVREHFADRVRVEHRGDIILAWEAGKSPMSAKKLDIEVEGSPFKCLRHVMTGFGVVEPPWLPGEIRDANIGDPERLAELEEGRVFLAGRMNLREALARLALLGSVWKLEERKQPGCIRRARGVSRTSKRAWLFQDAVFRHSLGDVRVNVILDASRNPQLLDVWFDGVAVFGLRDRSRRTTGEPQELAVVARRTEGPTGPQSGSAVAPRPGEAVPGKDEPETGAGVSGEAEDRGSVWALVVVGAACSLVVVGLAIWLASRRGDARAT